MKMFKKIAQRIHRIDRAFKNKPVDKITIGVDVRDCASCEYKMRCAECSLSTENARLRAELASYKSSEITAGAIRQSADEAEKDKPEVKLAPVKSEEILLYCVKEYKRSEWLTKGKTYTFTADENIIFDDGCGAYNQYDSYEEFCKRNPTISACLVPLVKRPAKVGEWVLVTDSDGYPNNCYKNGDLLKVTERPNLLNGVIYSSDHRFIWDKEYLVLDGYQSEPKKSEHYTFPDTSDDIGSTGTTE